MENYILIKGSDSMKPIKKVLLGVLILTVIMFIVSLNSDNETYSFISSILIMALFMIVMIDSVRRK